MLELRFVAFYPISNMTTIKYKNKNYKAIVFTGKKLWEKGIPAGDLCSPNTDVVSAFVLVHGGKNFGINSQKEIYFDGKKVYERLSYTDILGSNHGKRMGLKVQKDRKLHHLIREVTLPIEAIHEAINKRLKVEEDEK